MILKYLGNIDVFKKKIEKGEFFEKDILLYERSQNGDEVYVWGCKAKKNDIFVKNVYRKFQLIFFLGLVKEKFT